MPAYPGGDALLGLLVAEVGEPASIGATVPEDLLDALVAGPSL